MTGKREIAANVVRLNAYMDRHDLAALVIRSGKNFTYLAGFSCPGTLSRHLDHTDSPREVLLVWPRSGEPTLILDESTAKLAVRDGWVRRIEEYKGYWENPYARMADILGGLGLARSRIGAEKQYLSAARWEEMHALLPGAEIVDCWRMMAEVRWIKTAAEVEIFKKGADILDEAFLEVFPTVRAGETEAQVHARIVEACIRHGAQWAHGMLNSSRNPVPSYGGESDLAFQAGDVLRNDYVSYYLGYPGHQSRTVILGKPSDEQLRTYKIRQGIYRSSVEQCLVGARAGDIYRFAADAILSHGYNAKPIPLVGHGVGTWMHQQEPYIIEGSDEVLEAGMVIAMEPHFGPWQLQDLYLITEDGPKLLSDRFNTDEIFVIG
jgi:Xaa-Pro aminopeptidase